jgi:LCP family protein required for cell wall assembly
MAPLPPTRERPRSFADAGPAGAPAAAGSGQVRPRRSALRIVLIALGILLSVGIGAAAATAFFAKQQINDLLTPETREGQLAQRQLKAPLPGKPANILVIGSDKRSGAADNDRRSDTIMMVRLDPAGKTISMLSFPRDLYVPIPGHGTSKMNEAYSLGGSALTIKTVNELTGLDVNFVVNVDFKGFRGIIDTLGGVYVDVDRRYYNNHEDGGGNYAEIDLKPGYQLLRGRDALSFARYRHTDSDFHRIARQQQLTAQIRKQIGTSDVVNNIPGLFKVLNENSEMAVGGTNSKVSTRTVVDYIRLALSLNPKDVYQFEIQGGIGVGPGGASIVEADQAQIASLVEAFLNPDAEAQRTTADNVVGKAASPAATQPAPRLPDPGSVNIEVRNGNGIAGTAGKAAEQLAQLGYRVIVQPGAAGNADNSNYANTRVYYRADRDRALADSVAARFQGASVSKQQPGLAFDTRLLVIVGKTGYEVSTGTTTPATTTVKAPGNSVPEKAAPKVVTDAEYARSDFQQVRGKVRFPILYPTVRESSSTFDADGVWVYQISHKSKPFDAYRLVARTAAGDYWGFQGTNWSNPPIIEHPSRTVTRNGREYMLYFNGTRLHMVAWREGGGTYWITNSVLDKLSNETMLAIAEGVKRLPRA